MKETIEDVLIDYHSKDLGDNQEIILDVELDPLKITYEDDGVFNIDTKDYDYITLDIDTLYLLISRLEG